MLAPPPLLLSPPAYTDQEIYRRPDLQVTPKQRVQESHPNQDMTSVKRGKALDVSVSEFTCDYCCANISRMEESRLVRPVRDLNMQGYFAQFYGGFVLCSPACLTSLFYMFETEHEAKLMMDLALATLRATRRYTEDQFVTSTRGGRTGQTVGVAPNEDDVYERDTRTKQNRKE
jgi:hypothetical protein